VLKTIGENKSLRANLKAGKVEWKSPSNIALVKYWGKKDFQIPANPSLSFTLNNSFTQTSIHYQPIKSEKPNLKFYFEGKENVVFANKIKTFLENIYEYFPFLPYLDLEIESSNSFPHSAGIASSASSMSALSLGLCSIENEFFGTLKDKELFFEKASFISRIGSGSASRSVYGGFVQWGKEEVFGSDEVALTYNEDVAPIFKNLNDSILIASSGEKKVSSRAGHNLMNGHDFAEQRFVQASNNLKTLKTALKSGDFESFTDIVENEALSLHAMMLSSRPGFILMEPNTISIINKLRDFREKKGIDVCFTLDAGPNVHVIYPEKSESAVKQYIKEELLVNCDRGKWIDDSIGRGPEQVFVQ
jgi:diphosphomevalonate decarboxylase